ncbi:hypothetical protein DL96DRAFT_1498797 [Flagelloscypha sp. PMI_526]|nr:hypothetical protein DL96DRAFT_1498797 [Flagelloscypha sp. PMI_526]
MPFGEIVCGSPGSGKSTYCYGKHQLFTALSRPISIVNLDPANENIPYPCAISISDLITLQDAMTTHQLGPNGAMLYCIEYLEANLDWLEEKLDELGKDAYVLFDIPGQVELSTNHESLKRIVERLTKKGFRLAAVHLCDSHYITDASKYLSVLFLSLRAMLQLELPHINVLSKIDILSRYGELEFNLDFYTEVQDLDYLENTLNASLPPKFASLNLAFISVLKDFSILGFETLAVEDKQSMLHLTQLIDRATGYIFVPSQDAPQPPETILADPEAAATARPNLMSLMSTAAGPLHGPSVRDIQERWVDHKDEYDQWEKEQWRKEGDLVREEANKREQEKARRTNMV